MSRCCYPGCHAPLPPRHRKYCVAHSASASALWKRQRRRAAVADWRRRGGVDDPPYLDRWESRNAYRAYYRERMRESRTRARAARIVATAVGVGLAVAC